ncbi:hypothetical protein CDAR_54251 [Caerostris darwini]|uniref:Uncharacterized protein n=1 Tax=Caerostris darwini TaxID=1538125 RepID=A0AAV4Q709_9ARAC|nr:hypothetical protein CDAR_54251 [Caerostris darwini]
MKGFGFASILFVSVLILMLISVIMMAYVMYACANAKPFELDTQLNVTTVKQDGVEAHEFFASHKVWMIGPTVCNLIGIALMGLLFVMS